MRRGWWDLLTRQQQRRPSLGAPYPRRWRALRRRRRTASPSWPGGTQQLIGLVTTTLIATVTIAYIYLVQITDPLATIGTTPRAVQQILPFVQFLLGQGAGILLLSQDGTEPAAP